MLEAAAPSSRRLQSHGCRGCAPPCAQAAAPRVRRRGAPDGGFALFEGECLKWPGFVEFDDVNGKVRVVSA